MLGRYECPVTQLIPPQEQRILRKVDKIFVNSLKENIKCDATGTAVPSLVVFCNDLTPESFDKLKDAYKYKVGGGLHTYTAKLELSKECPDNPFYQSVEATVYVCLSDEQALRLALRHNLNGHFVQADLP